MTALIDTPVLPPVRRPPLDLAGMDLSAREVEVLGLVSLSLSNGEIGQRLGLAETTVKSHVRRILVKLGAAGREHAVRLGFEAGYLALVPARPRPHLVAERAVATSSRRTLTADLAHIAVEVRTVDPRTLRDGDLEIFALRLERAAKAAAVQTAGIEILRAQAADREACRAGLAAVAALVPELEQHLAALSGADAERARWALGRMRLAVEKAGVPVRATGLETLEG